MTVFSKILKAGEGKRVRQLAELVPPINELADEMAALSDEELRGFIELADTLGIDALVEVHDEPESRRALDAGARNAASSGVGCRHLRV